MTRHGIFFSFLLLAACVRGQSPEPRLYSNAPTGLNFLLGGYAYSTGNAITDPSIQIEGGMPDIHSPFAAYAHSFGLWGRSAKYDIVVPYSFLSGTAKSNGQPVSRTVDGFADPTSRIAMNFIGAPALSLALPINRNNSIKLYASSGVSTRTGSDFDTYGLAWQYRWGGGV